MTNSLSPLIPPLGSHGVAGLFFKYDMSALKVHVIQERDSIGQFLTRLSSMICGLYVCSGKNSANFN